MIRAGRLDPRPRVLVVDDDLLMRTSLEVVLSESYHVDLAASAAEALARIQEGTDVVVLDVRLGAVDGYAVARELRRSFPDTPVIFHTAYPMSMTPEELINQYHPFGYLTKEGELGKLMRLVQEAAGLRRLRRAEEKVLRDQGLARSG